ncbi:uncharacterized protein LOC122513165 [Polistes fuscatus]|uniref:uncharacterized protein LOC122513165 n=1 Tax=Polistes fuscatus TaxID=30207 RepID=UPI001CA93E3E|nr:uncharacterized protein LOC122513165 [Polistes fuscatus]
MSTTMEAIIKGSRLLKIFDPETMNFFHWINHFEYIVDFVHIKKNVKVELLLYLMNLQAHSDILQKVAPNDPYSLPYEVLISHFEELYGLYQGEWAANYRFLLRGQFDGESVLHYIDALTKIACKISVCLRNNKYLIIRFVNGLKDDYTKRVLHCSNNLTLDKAIAIAAQIEIFRILSKEN